MATVTNSTTVDNLSGLKQKIHDFANELAGADPEARTGVIVQHSVLRILKRIHDAAADIEGAEDVDPRARVDAAIVQTWAVLATEQLESLGVDSEWEDSIGGVLGRSLTCAILASMA